MITQSKKKPNYKTKLKELPQDITINWETRLKRFLRTLKSEENG